MSTCKRHVWVTMCEKSDGSRTGKYNGFKYASVPKDEPKPVKRKATKKAATKKTTTATKKPTTKATTKTNKALDTFAAAIFKKLGKGVSSKTEIVMELSLDWRWMKPAEAKTLVDAMTRKGVLETKSGFMIPSATARKTTVPAGYKPNVAGLLKEA